MSGVKDSFVQLRASERDRLMASARRADDMAANYRSALNNAESRMRSEMSGQLANLDRRHDRFENALSGMSSNMQRIERENTQRLRHLAGEFHRNLENMGGQLRSEFRRDMGAMEGRLEGRIEEQGRELRTEMHQHRREIDQRLNAQRREYTELFNAVSEDVQDLRQELGRFEHSVDQRFTGVGQELERQQAEYIGMIREQGEWFSDALAAQRQDLEGQIQDLNRRIEAEKQSKAERAAQWAQDTQTLLTAIDQSYRHEKFQPGELQKLRSELAFADSNLRNGDFEAAISKSQETYLRAQTLRMVLEQLELEWQAHLNAARHSAAEVIAACEAQKVAEFVLEEGEESIKAEVDFWSEGKLTALRARAEAEQKRLADADAMSLQDLQQSVVESEQMREAVELLAEQAKEALIASQLRNNIGQAIEEVLTESGWELSDATYEGEDFRRAVHVKFKHLNGQDELVTIISPEQTPDNTIRNKLNVSFFDRSSNDETLRQERLNVMTEILREEGLDCSRPQCAPGTEQQATGDPAHLDFEAVRRNREQRKPG